MSGDLRGVDLKLVRAHAQIADLKQRVETVLDPSAYRFAVKFDPETGQHVCRVHGVPIVPAEWALDIGEIVYQLRSALDHLAWQLVKFDGRTPGYRTQFPILDAPVYKNGEAQPVNLSPSIRSKEILLMLEECQPYKGAGHDDLSPFEARRMPLWTLRWLNNIDKHRLLLAVVCVPNIMTMWWGVPWGAASPGVTLNTVQLKDCSPVAWFDFRGAEPPADFNPHVSLQIVVQETKVARIRFENIVGVLEMLHSLVSVSIIDARFRPLFTRV